jgi:hypothetical protein
LVALSVKVTPRQFEALQARATADRVTMSALIRRALALATRPVRSPSDVT